MLQKPRMANCGSCVVGGVSVLDPHHLAFNELPPPVHIEQVTADDKIYDATNGLRLPARTRDLAIDYTALSLVAPEKVRFRFMLEGQDADWKEVVNDRQVQYSNLPPGPYRFRVIASNNSGVWNEAGATLEFSIAPAFYQTRWFQAAMAFSFARCCGRRINCASRNWRAHFNRTLDARVSERTRIARELHDTLLQSFHGLLLQFQTAAYLLPERPAEAREQLDGAIRSRREGNHRRPRCRAGIAGLHHRKEQPRSGDQRPGRRTRERSTCSAAPRHSTWPSKARREISIRSFVTRSIKIAAEALRNASGTRRPDGSRSRSATTTSNSACVCVTMVRGSIRRCSQTRGSRATTDCAACRNVPRDRRETGGVERSRRRDGSGTEHSRQSRVRNGRDALLVVTGVCVEDAGTCRTRWLIMARALTHPRTLATASAALAFHIRTLRRDAELHCRACTLLAVVSWQPSRDVP